jgi:hypothetical protein
MRSKQDFRGMFRKIAIAGVGLLLVALLALPVAASHGPDSGGVHANDVYGLKLEASRANVLSGSNDVYGLRLAATEASPTLTYNDVYGLRALAETSSSDVWNDVFRIRLSGRAES